MDNKEFARLVKEYRSTVETYLENRSTKNLRDMKVAAMRVDYSIAVIQEAQHRTIVFGVDITEKIK